jgi:hypothetical protein
MASTHESISPIHFIDKLVKKTSWANRSRSALISGKSCVFAFAFDDDGRLPWDTIIYSCVKKSGNRQGHSRDISAEPSNRWD